MKRSLLTLLVFFLCPAASWAEEEAMGLVVFASKPMGAEIVIDEKPTGKKTPIPQPLALRLPVGKHTVVFTLAGKSTAPQEFELTERNRYVPLVVRGTFP